MGQPGFFDLERRLDALSAKGDPLETIKTTVPWEVFRADIEAVTGKRAEERKSSAGRKPYDAILKFKILVLQSLYNLSDEQTEALKAALKASLGKDVAITAEIDPAILGGLIVKVGSRMIDSSLRTKLNAMTTRLKRAS